MVPSLHSIRTKGVIGSIKRFFNMRKRYGFGPKKMKRNLKLYMNILEENDIPFTMFVPALIFEKHSGFIKSIKNPSMEIGLHGYIHIDYRELTADEFKMYLDRAIDIFREADIEIKSFRAPYLALRDESINELAGPISYDSSQSYDSEVLPDELNDHARYNKIRRYYDPVAEPNITKKHGITRVPVWLPDDEIMIDRFGMDDNQIGVYWVRMAEKAIEKDAPLVIQLHPERIRYCEKALKRLIEFGSKRGARFLKLSELQEDWKREDEKSVLKIAITGDLDMMSLSDKKMMKREEKRLKKII